MADPHDYPEVQDTVEGLLKYPAVPSFVRALYGWQKKVSWELRVRGPRPVTSIFLVNKTADTQKDY